MRRDLVGQERRARNLDHRSDRVGDGGLEPPRRLGRPVTIRTLDPPLHEFLPKRDELLREIAALGRGAKGKPARARLERTLAKVEELHEFNPMLGFRGCRLGLLHPEITRMQARAIFEAAAAVVKSGKEVHPEIMVPLVGDPEELRRQRQVIEGVAAETTRRLKASIPYT
ncbi:MAG TPA: putative PEP-binding protein, partial [Candidatus Eisenbacteria bacterium]|nr:putative PEP-binding protein [Candidatus Eisenbacteria bacterium]